MVTLNLAVFARFTGSEILNGQKLTKPTADHADLQGSTLGCRALKRLT